ncbi:glycosyltransferase family 4 protein [Fontivita pretiosa]|uniref:glycosyltransferase family 4 protein n=1 Tax=Fontivita pretiosa TaxID=2989684 RepID=UPI003D17256D
MSLDRPVLINAVSARAGGGVNDLLHTLPRLRDALGKRGWNINVFCAAEAIDELLANGYPPREMRRINTRSPLRRGLWEFVRLPQLVRSLRPAVVFHFSNFIFRDLPVPQVVVLRSLTYFAPEYAAMRRKGYQNLRYRLGRYYSSLTIERAAAVFCISQTHRRQIIQSVGTMGERVRVAPLGVQIPESARRLIGAQRRELLELLPTEHRQPLQPLVQAGRRVVLNVSHYYTQKNFLTLLRAMELLARRRSDVTLVITAGIEQYRGGRNEQVEQEIRLARTLRQRGVLCDLGPVSKQCVWPLLAMADVFTFPSSLESFGHPLLEAMGMDVPVVAADTEIHREICGQAAMMHPVFDPEALAEAIERATDDGALRTRLIAAGRLNIRRFSWDTHVEQLVQAILEVAGQPSTDSIAGDEQCAAPAAPAVVQER